MENKINKFLFDITVHDHLPTLKTEVQKILKKK